MPLNKVAVISRDDQFSTIEIYSFEDSNMQGLFSNSLYGKNKVFKNLIELILMIEDCMNSISFPQPMSRYRKMDNVSELDLQKTSYRDKAEFNIPDEETPEEWSRMQPIATFRERIAFRTISGWQGDAECLESGNSVQFKSDLEFITFMVHETEKRQNTEK